MTIDQRIELNNGVEIPWLGLGVFQAKDGEEVVQAIHWALEEGYRLIDTASVYGNEKGVGEALRTASVPRDRVFVTTKVWNSDQGYDPPLAAMDQSLERLGLDYVDLYLVHWPVKDRYLDTWRAMERILAEGKARAVGVSNFLIHHLEDLANASDLVPAVNQVEFHPRLLQPELLAHCARAGIRLEAWSPIMQGKVLDIPEIQSVAEKHGKTPVQVVLRWDLQHGAVTIPKSVHRERIRENADIFDFQLSDGEMAVIDGLDRHQRIGPDPDHFSF
jgi:diketogulonate reductase-like aldo/keto reductase